MTPAESRALNHVPVVMSSRAGLAPTAFAESAEPTAEERWTRWVAKGAAHNRRMDSRMRFVSAAVVTGLLVWLAFAITMR